MGPVLFLLHIAKKYPKKIPKLKKHLAKNLLFVAESLCPFRSKPAFAADFVHLPGVKHCRFLGFKQKPKLYSYIKQTLHVLFSAPFSKKPFDNAPLFSQLFSHSLTFQVGLICLGAPQRVTLPRRAAGGNRSAPLAAVRKGESSNRRQTAVFVWRD